VISHGGPTGATNPRSGPKLQYWTQRGFAVVDVNYGGSSGYGAPTASGSTAAGASSTSTTW
jgi:dipeptidyl aminopeptidase/acylaminoacyl peptidase